MANLYIIDAVVLGEIKDGYRLKISLIDMGLYILGMRVTHSTKDESGWWVQSPSHVTPKGWMRDIEFDKKKDLWSEIEQACLDAVQLFANESADEDMSEEGFDKAFGIEPSQNKPDPFSPTGDLS